MTSDDQRAIYAGITMLLVGGLLIGVGLYVPTQCTAGVSLTIQQLGQNESVNPSRTVPFVELSTSEQQIFLTAFDNENNIAGPYDDWPQSRFKNVQAVTYKGARYEIITAYKECFASYIWFPTVIGTAFSLLGFVTLYWAKPSLRLWR